MAGRMAPPCGRGFPQRSLRYTDTVLTVCSRWSKRQPGRAAGRVCLAAAVREGGVYPSGRCGCGGEQYGGVVHGVGSTSANSDGRGFELSVDFVLDTQSGRFSHCSLFARVPENEPRFINLSSLGVAVVGSRIKGVSGRKPAHTLNTGSHLGDSQRT